MSKSLSIVDKPYIWRDWLSNGKSYDSTLKLLADLIVEGSVSFETVKPYIPDGYYWNEEFGVFEFVYFDSDEYRPHHSLNNYRVVFRR